MLSTSTYRRGRSLKKWKKCRANRLTLENFSAKGLALYVEERCKNYDEHDDKDGIPPVRNDVAWHYFFWTRNEMKNLLFTPPGCISLEHASLATAAINRERRKDDRDVPSAIMSACWQ